MLQKEEFIAGYWPGDGEVLLLQWWPHTSMTMVITRSDIPRGDDFTHLEHHRHRSRISEAGMESGEVRDDCCTGVRAAAPPAFLKGLRGRGSGWAKSMELQSMQLQSM